MDRPPNTDHQYRIDVDADRALPVDEADAHDVLLRYQAWEKKGRIRAGRRVTILAETTTCAPGAVVRVDHVLEAVAPGHELYVMGPKPVWSEYVNGYLQEAGESPESSADPFVPQEYDGRVLDSPGLDANFAPSYYRFPRSGRYEIRWQPGSWRSNRLVIVVADQPRTNAA